MFSWKNHFVILADDQHWANEVLFASLEHLTPDALSSDQGLFLRSIHHTLDNMLAVGELMLARLKGETRTVNTREIEHPDWRELQNALRRSTRRLQAWLAAQDAAWFEGEIEFADSDARPPHVGA